MTTGRKPIPTALKLIKGGSHTRNINKNELVLPAAQPLPPNFLSEDALIEWDYMVDILFVTGVLTNADRASLAAYCQAYGVWAQAERAIQKMAEKDPINYALIIKTSNGNAIQNPLRGIANCAMRDMVRYAAEFGITPAARTRVSARDSNEKDTDIYAEFFTTTK